MKPSLLLLISLSNFCLHCANVQEIEAQLAPSLDDTSSVSVGHKSIDWNNTNAAMDTDQESNKNPKVHSLAIQATLQAQSNQIILLVAYIMITIGISVALLTIELTSAF